MRGIQKHEIPTTLKEEKSMAMKTHSRSMRELGEWKVTHKICATWAMRESTLNTKL